MFLLTSHYNTVDLNDFVAIARERTAANKKAEKTTAALRVATMMI
jgi:hypothetical protein